LKLIRFENSQGQIRQGIAQESNTAEVIHLDSDWRVQFTGRTDRIARLLSPVEPSNIYCVGKNYAEHAAEFGSDIPEHPVIFMKPTTSIIGPGSAVVLPAACEHGPEVDYEVELAAVIGPKPVRNIAEADALDAVFGYTVANDISARKWQKHGGGDQWIRGKSFDTFCPLGPALVTADELADPQDLHLATRLNGKTMQEDTTANMIFSIARIISFLSRDTTLLPGTLILTGTPSGVGAARQPPVFLHPGDEIEVEVQGIGVLANPVVAAKSV